MSAANNAEALSVVPVSALEFSKGQAIFERAVETGLKCISSADTEPELAEDVRKHCARVVIVGVTPYSDELYDVLPAGGIISRFGVGHDSIDKARATAEGILVTNTPGVLDVAVAEHAIWLMGAVVRHVSTLDRGMKNDIWEPQTGSEVRGKSLLLAGFGGIGREVAKIAALGLGMRVTAFGRTSQDELPAKLSLSSWAEVQSQFGIAAYTNDLDEAIAEADVVSVHLASTPETCHFFDSCRFGQMKPGVCFVNTARGAVVDEDALYEALAESRIAAAGIDVYTTEPYVPQSPERDLRKLPNVVLTPHVGSNSREANERMAHASLRNVVAALAGRYEELTLLNPKVLRKE